MVQTFLENGNLHQTLLKHLRFKSRCIANSSSLDEIHVIVIDEDGKITGIVGEILEDIRRCIYGFDAKDSEGNSNYYVDKLRYNSNYIFWTNHDSNFK